MNWLFRLAVNRGIFGGSRFFAALGVVMALLRLLQRLAGTGPRTIYTHQLKSGEALVVTDIGRSRSKRK